jgi:hypothetical protein
MNAKDANGEYIVKCRHQTPEHLIEQSSVSGVGNYRLRNAPCAYTEGTSWHLGDHGVMSGAREDRYQQWRAQNPNATWNTAEAAKIGAEVHHDSNVSAECNPVCTEKQLIEGHRRMNVNATDALTPTQTGIADPAEQARRREVMQLQQQQLIEDT